MAALLDENKGLTTRSVRSHVLNQRLVVQSEPSLACRSSPVTGTRSPDYAILLEHQVNRSYAKYPKILYFSSFRRIGAWPLSFFLQGTELAAAASYKDVIQVGELLVLDEAEPMSIAKFTMK